MLKINLNSPVPIYEQLVTEISRMIDQDILKDGETLPTIRSLASQIDVANNTVARAYQELEGQGLVESGGRRGTVVRKSAAAGNDNDIKVFKSPIRELLQKGYSKKEIVQMFNDSLSLIFD